MTHQQAHNRHARSIGRVLDRQALLPAREVFDEELDELEEELEHFERRHRTDTVTLAIYGLLLALLLRRAQRLGVRVGQELVGSTRETLFESLGALGVFLQRVAPRFALEDHHILRVLTVRRAAMEELRRRSGVALAGVLVDQVRRRVEMAVPMRWTLRALAMQVRAALEGSWWQVERTIRTETSYAYNEAQAVAIGELAREHRGILLRWTELVDDTTGEPLDMRVGKDSLVLHGQLAPPGGVFVMPPDKRAPVGMIGQSWNHPPNRPNDRAVLTPWHPSWNIPGWRWDGTQRVVAP